MFRFKQTPVKPVQPKQEEKKPAAPVAPRQEDTGIYFNDDTDDAGTPPATRNEKKKNEPVYDLEDEYYELDGF